MGQHTIYFLCQSILAVFIDQHFTDDFLNEIVLLVDNVGFIIPVQHIWQIHRVMLLDFLILLQQLDCIPTVIRQTGILLFQFRYNEVNLILNDIAVNHCVLGMVVMPVF